MKMLLAMALLSVAACNRSEPEASAPAISAQEAKARHASQAPAATRQHWTFLNQIRQDDTLSGSIHRTLLNEQQQIGVVLYTSVKPEDVAGLMRWALTEMAHKFPHEDIALAVYMTANPPRQIGVAHLDGKTAKINYTPL
ncbi:MAG: hypothetical protein ABIU29_05350 [Chthoniobacterales bacterium]